MVVVRLLFSVLMLRYGECNTNLFPPTDASWFDVGAVLLPTEPWEETCVCEPQVYWDADQDEFRMYYRGGWSNMSVGIATSKTGINWTKYKNNPVYGGGGRGAQDKNKDSQSTMTMTTIVIDFANFGRSSPPPSTLRNGRPKKISQKHHFMLLFQQID